MATFKEYLNMNPQVRDIYNKVRDKYTLKSHDLSHIERVVEYCLLIAQTEGGDTELLILASLLHDLGRSEETSGEGHNTLSIKHTRSILKEYYKEDAIDKVVEIIRCHSTDSDRQPATREEKIVYDADKLDSYGFLGVVRFFILAGEKGWGINESLNKAVERIIKLEENMGFYTGTAKKIGYMKALRAFAFYYRLSKETKNKKAQEKLEKFITQTHGAKGYLILRMIGTFY